MFKKLTPLDDRLFTALVLSVIALTITLSALFTRFDYLHYDLGRYLSASPAPADIVIVAIDENSLSEIGRWPWSRTRHAMLVEKLHRAHAKVIGFDVIFAEPDLNEPEADIALAQAFKVADNVVLPMLLEVPYFGAPVKLSQPTAHLLESAAGLGRVHVPLDEDGIARSFYLWEGLKAEGLQAEDLAGKPAEDDLRRHFSQAVLALAGQLPANISSAPQLVHHGLFNVDFKPAASALLTQDRRYVKFLGPPGHFQRISYHQVLSGQFPVNFFKDKIVLVGATAAGLGDALPTPVSALSQPMPGVEFHANAIAGMRSGNLIQHAPIWLTCIIVMMLSVLPLLFLPRLSPFKALCLVAGYYLAVTFVAIALPQYLNVWVPPAGALIAILLTYPIWSWRKLESAQIYLDNALKELQAELGKLGVEKANLESIQARDEMQSRIAKVEITSQFLRESQQKRLDTLAFISHDIRAPLAAAIMQLEEVENATSSKSALRVTQMLNRALNMADEFLQSSRAEMVDTSKFSDIQVNGLLQETLDDAYTLAQSNHIKLNASLSDEPMWIQGNFGLLQRAIANILSNAIKYSQPNTAVQIVLSKVDDEMVLNITDTGPGIPPEKVSKLFKRFSRVEGEYQLPVGTGLGLYFVDVTIQKHHGRIFVESMLNEGTTFTIRLPLVATQFEA